MAREEPAAPTDPRLDARRRIGLSDAMRGVGKRDHTTRALAVGFAAVLHAGLFTAATRLPAASEAPPKITEVELAPPPPPPPPEPDKPVEEPDKPVEAPTRPQASPAPQVARAGNVLVARSDTPTPAADAVDFVTDPEGRSFGSGIVARGGTLDRADNAAPVAPRGPVTVRGATAAGRGVDAVTATENLSRGARLDDANPCAGYYPRAASADTGEVTLSLVVRAGGELASATVVSEAPAGHGFGAAARACLAKKVFVPAMDKEGRAVTAALSLRVRFTR